MKSNIHQSTTAIRAYVLCKIIAVLCGLISTANVVSARDTLAILPVRTLGLSIFGTALSGVGVTYDHSFDNSEKGYPFWRVASSYPDFNDPYLFPTAGIGYSRSITRNKKIFIGACMNAGALIAFNPTPKELRDYWDSIGFYGGNYVNPVELIIIPELNVTYLAERWFARLQITPLVAYERIGKRQLDFIPWGGVAFGFRFK